MGKVKARAPRIALALAGGAWPKADIVLLEPGADDAELHRANIFPDGQRRRMATHAYQRTRAWSRRRQPRLAATFAAHGIRIRDDGLRDRARGLVPAPRPRRLDDAVTRLHAVRDDLAGAPEPA